VCVCVYIYRERRLIASLRQIFLATVISNQKNAHTTVTIQ
jgi:hypothetical protein